MKCRVCESADLVPLNVPADRFPAGRAGGPWWRCLVCGSDSSELTYAEVRDIYGTASYRELIAEATNGDRAAFLKTFHTNVDWFRAHRHLAPDNTFLDVGHHDGAMLELMQADGWSVHGFDVCESLRLGTHTTIAPRFHHGLFPRRYAAVHCREVLEHVEDARSLIRELVLATMPGGLVQVQTPRPYWPLVGMSQTLHVCYQREHLQLISPARLELELRLVGLTVLDRMIWDGGQAWLCRVTRARTPLRR